MKFHFMLSTSTVVLMLAFCVQASAIGLLGPMAETFAVLGGGGVTSAGATTIVGNVGSAPTNSITGIPPGAVTGGALTSVAVAGMAQADALAAYHFLAAQTPTQILTGVDLGGLTLTPGVYQFASSAQLTGTLTLDALGLYNAVFVFEIGSTLTTASSSNVNVINSNSTDGIYWQIGSSATLGDNSIMAGNIIANTSITLDPHAQIGAGRALAGVVATDGIVTMAGDNSVRNDGTGNGGDGYAGGYQSVLGGTFALIGASSDPPVLPLVAPGPVAVPEASSLAIVSCE